MMIVKEDRQSEKIEGFTRKSNNTLNQVTSQQIALDTAQFMNLKEKAIQITVDCLWLNNRQ